MQLISALLIALLVIFWWIAVWGIFDIYTENKTKKEKMRLYLIILGIIFIVIWAFPNFIYRL